LIVPSFGMAAPFSVTLPESVTVLRSMSSVVSVVIGRRSHTLAQAPTSHIENTSHVPQSAPHFGSGPHSSPPHCGSQTQPDVSNARQSSKQVSVPESSPTLSQVAPPRSLPSHASIPSFAPLPQDSGAPQPDALKSPQLAAHESVPSP
jgi:hypothetical protein